VPLVGENRILAHHGLKSLERSSRPGIRALLAVCGAGGRELLAEDLAFQIAPRINAAGRLDHARHAVELLLAEDAGEAKRLAADLDEMNVRRRAIEAEILQRALLQADAYADADRWPVLVLADEGWHQGVVGIVAGRLVQRFDRPTIVIGMNGGRGRGSALDHLLHGGLHVGVALVLLGELRLLQHILEGGGAGFGRLALHGDGPQLPRSRSVES